MTIPLRRTGSRLGIGLLATTALAAGGLAVASGIHHQTAYHLTATPAGLLPATVSTADPVRVVSTGLDPTGRPIVTVHTATDRATAATLMERGQVDAKIRATGIPGGSDPYRPRQWDLQRLHATTAWQKSTGAGVTVAVLDTGVDASQPDLAGQVLPGYDAIAHGGTADSDPNGHGTHVAGTIAALTGNRVGVGSIAPDAKILPIRVMDADGNGYMSAAADGIVYATDHGAGVINMSFSANTQVDAVTAAVAYARGKGVVVIAAAGNDRQAGSPVAYPAATDGVIAVAATNQKDQVADFSTAGSYVDLAAPGTDILSTWPQNTIKAMSGTSMAAPHVSAIAALIVAKDPTLTPDLVEKVLERSAQDLGAPGRDDDYGYGRVDAAASLALAAAIPKLPKAPSTGPTTPAPTTKKAKARPTIKVASLRQLIGADVTASTTFTITAFGKPWAQQPVQVCLAPTGSAYTCTDDTTTEVGTVTVLQTASRTYAVKVLTTASDSSEPVASPVVTVTVGSRVTLAGTAPGTLEVSLAGAVGQTVQVQRMSGTRWVLAGTYPAEADHVVTGLASGRYRVVVPSVPAMIGSTSATVQL
ncbi:MAG TPA: S8 family peptidase [Actinoplanes sp.]